MDIDITKKVQIVYTNWKNIKSEREIIPVCIYYGQSKYHGTLEQWFLLAFDCIKEEDRNFAMKDIHSWKEV